MKRIKTLPSLPERPVDGHKGTFGRVLVIAGSRGMSGAACLSASSALRSGAGLVFAAIPQSIASIVAGFEPSYLTLALPEDAEGRTSLDALSALLSHAEQKDAVAIGPGLGTSTGLQLLVAELYRSVECPLVVDADGLNLLAHLRGNFPQSNGPRVLTPHPGEFARLTGQSISATQADREKAAVCFAADHDIVLLLKGPGTIITDGQRCATNTTGNNGMATGGTGDVLTGIVTALLAQGLDAFEAAQLAAHVHGQAGDLAAAEKTQRGMIASDLIEFLPAAWRQLETDEAD